jgi:hypothetical protein
MVRCPTRAMLSGVKKRTDRAPGQALVLALVFALLGLWLLVGCPATTGPGPRPLAHPSKRSAAAALNQACSAGRRAKSQLTLPADGCPRYLQNTVALPLPPTALTVHLELARLRAHVDGRRVIAGVWEGLRADSMAAGQLLPYLKRCGVRPRRDLAAVTLSQPLHGRPDADRAVIFWGLVAAQRVVACLRRAMEADGARTSFLPAGGEPGFMADRPVSDLHLDAVALDSSALIVASGRRYRSILRSLIRSKGRSLSQAAFYRRAVHGATSRTLLLALAPRLPRRLPHVRLPADAHRNLRGTSFALSRCTKRCPAPNQNRLRLTGDLDVGKIRRANRWADKAPSKLRLLALLSPSAQRPLLRRMRFSSTGSRLQVELLVRSKDLGPLGRLLSRWLPW